MVATHKSITTIFLTLEKSQKVEIREGNRYDELLPHNPQ